MAKPLVIKQIRAYRAKKIKNKASYAYAKWRKTLSDEQRRKIDK